MTKLYHAAVFVPIDLLCNSQVVRFKKLDWSTHAQLELVNDKYGMIPAAKVPKSFDATAWELIELEVVKGIVRKYVFRRPVDETRSLVLVLRPAMFEDDTAIVVTAWTNLNTDKHKSLDRSKYATA